MGEGQAVLIKVEPEGNSSKSALNLYQHILHTGALLCCNTGRRVKPLFAIRQGTTTVQTCQSLQAGVCATLHHMEHNFIHDFILVANEPDPEIPIGHGI